MKPIIQEVIMELEVIMVRKQEVVVSMEQILHKLEKKGLISLKGELLRVVGLHQEIGQEVDPEVQALVNNFLYNNKVLIL